MRRLKKRGDTIIEVMMAVAIFAILAVITIELMNDGINSAQRTLEFTMARNEIDGQAEALRYIHQSYVAERQLSESESQFRKLWLTLSKIAIKPKSLEDDNNAVKVAFDINLLQSCSEIYDGENSMIKAYNAFVLNTRLVLPKPKNNITTYAGLTYDELLDKIVVGVKAGDDEQDASVSQLTNAVVYPRIVYGKTGLDDLSRKGWGSSITYSGDNASGSLAEKTVYNYVNKAEGVFIIAVGDNAAKPSRSNYYDFYIRTCWHSVGSTAPSTMTTIVRLYNPEVIE